MTPWFLTKNERYLLIIGDFWGSLVQTGSKDAQKKSGVLGGVLYSQNLFQRGPTTLRCDEIPKNTLKSAIFGSFLALFFPKEFLKAFFTGFTLGISHHNARWWDPIFLGVTTHLPGPQNFFEPIWSGGFGCRSSSPFFPKYQPT